MICLATLDVADAAAMSSSVRIYEVGRRKALTGTGDSDDDEEDDGAEEEVGLGRVIRTNRATVLFCKVA